MPSFFDPSCLVLTAAAVRRHPWSGAEGARLTTARARDLGEVAECTWMRKAEAELKSGGKVTSPDLGKPR